MSESEFEGREVAVVDVKLSPYFFLALATMIIGTQLFLTGFLGELIVRNSPRRNDYEIEEEIRIEKPSSAPAK